MFDTEREVKILDVDPETMTKKLLSLGATKIGSSLMRRYVYDLPGPAKSWVRLRDNGKTVTLTIKSIEHDGLEGTKELEISVDSFDKTAQMLGVLGLNPKAYQENRRTSFQLDSTAVEIDEWPKIPPYVEIEGESRDSIKKVLDKLGVQESTTTSENTEKIYLKYGLDIHSFKKLTF